MSSMTRTLALGGLAFAGAALACRADVTLPNSPAAYRLYNNAVVDPRTAGCGRCEPLPPFNRGLWLNNPRGTGVDDPWRPPKVWPQTRYPVVPAYTRPSFGFYETRWRVISVCGTPPWTRTPPVPMPPPKLPAPAQRPAAAAPGSTPAPNRTPVEATPPRAVPPKATPPHDLQQRTNEALPAPNLPPANEPRADGNSPTGMPARSAMAEPDEFNSGAGASPVVGTRPEITVSQRSDRFRGWAGL